MTMIFQNGLPSKIDAGTLLEKARVPLLATIEAGFREYRDPYKKEWARLSNVTIKKRRRKGILHSHILVETGEMKGSMGSMIKRWGDVSNLTIGFTDSKAAIHQLGNKFERIPIRLMLPVEHNIPSGWTAILNHAFKAI